MMADTLRNRRAESALADAIIQCLYSAPPDHWSAANVLLALLTQEIAFLPDALRERMMADIEGGALRTRVGYLEARVRAARGPTGVESQPPPSGPGGSAVCTGPNFEKEKRLLSFKQTL